MILLLFIQNIFKKYNTYQYSFFQVFVIIDCKLLYSSVWFLKVLRRPEKHGTSVNLLLNRFYFIFFFCILKKIFLTYYLFTLTHHHFWMIEYKFVYLFEVDQNRKEIALAFYKYPQLEYPPPIFHSLRFLVDQ